MKIKANAKINIGLKVIGKKENGYHELDMIIAPISLYDDIDLEVTENNEVIVEFDDNSIAKDNTIYKAMTLMKTQYGISSGIKVKVEKRIPVQAGLGGGSSDAATCMLAINQLLGLKKSKEELATIGLQVGADVPFFIYNTLARVQGIGEKITPINAKFSRYVLLVKPFKGINTKECFAIYNSYKIDEHGSIDDLQKNLINNNLNSDNLINSLLEPALELVPAIKNIIKRLKYAGLKEVQMSGSGSTVFALCEDKEKLEQIAANLKDKYHFVGVYKIIA